MATVLISKENPDSQKFESYMQMMHEGAHVGCHAAIGRHSVPCTARLGGAMQTSL